MSPKTSDWRSKNFYLSKALDMEILKEGPEVGQSQYLLRAVLNIEWVRDWILGVFCEKSILKMALFSRLDHFYEYTCR